MPLYLLGGLAFVVIAIAGAPRRWIVGVGLVTVGVIVGALCALLPVGPVVATFLWIDRWEPEPPRLLLFAFLWGACFAALSALVINSGAALLIDGLTGQGDLYGAVVIAPIVEEALKGAFLVGLLIFRYREFDGVVDGIVYAGLVAAGFAFTENILYIGRAFAEDTLVGPSGAVLGVLLVRGVLSPFAHPLFTALIGIGAGIAARHRSMGVRVLAVAVGYLLAVGLHALWNGSATLFGGLAFFGVYAFVMVPVFVAMVGVVVWQRRREQRTVADQLPLFAQAGWIAPSEVELLSSLSGRRGWQAAVRRRSGRATAKAVVEYQAAVTELAFLRARIARGTVGSAAPIWHEQAVATLVRARTTAVGHPEALTVAIRHRGAQNWTPPPPGPPPPPIGAPQSWPPPASPSPPPPGRPPHHRR
ncbi:MAG: PrsW family intramembrane metalloprotease [Pseudonocardia sp.]|nr:PrsW family intramembrane metalloprotease [Pseudonocardia sp.]